MWLRGGREHDWRREDMVVQGQPSWADERGDEEEGEEKDHDLLEHILVIKSM